MPLAPNITHRLELRPGPAPRDIRHGLFQALGLPGEPPARPIEFDTLLKEAPAEESRVLVCDEAQRMKKTGFEFRRSRWDDKRTNIAVICAGGDGCYKVLRRGPRLASKIFIWQEFTRMRNPPLHRTQRALRRRRAWGSSRGGRPATRMPSGWCRHRARPSPEYNANR
ncbi:AAA family ATPase [Streptomyces sp. 058-1L]|uniref:AAA family ATPase n=1 Tax=Streptomyces sp. 058-1L TaxID=2789266 RepID=UPI00398011C1